jgi:hypothetical protein
MPTVHSKFFYSLEFKNIKDMRKKKKTLLHDQKKYAEIQEKRAEKVINSDSYDELLEFEGSLLDDVSEALIGKSQVNNIVPYMLEMLLESPFEPNDISKVIYNSGGGNKETFKFFQKTAFNAVKEWINGYIQHETNPGVRFYLTVFLDDLNGIYSNLSKIIANDQFIDRSKNRLTATNNEIVVSHLTMIKTLVTSSKSDRNNLLRDLKADKRFKVPNEWNAALIKCFRDEEWRKLKDYLVFNPVLFKVCFLKVFKDSIQSWLEKKNAKFKKNELKYRVESICDNAHVLEFEFSPKLALNKKYQLCGLSNAKSYNDLIVSVTGYVKEKLRYKCNIQDKNKTFAVKSSNLVPMGNS